jgi:hypothetical protein
MLDNGAPQTELNLIEPALKELTDLLCSLDPSDPEYQSFKMANGINVEKPPLE